MRKQKFLVVDTETGGLSCDEHSLLSFAGIAWTPGADRDWETNNITIF